MGEQRRALAPENPLEEQLGADAADHPRDHLPDESWALSYESDRDERRRDGAVYGAELREAPRNVITHGMASTSHLGDDEAIEAVAVLSRDGAG